MLLGEDTQLQESSRHVSPSLRPTEAFSGSLAQKVYLSLKEAIIRLQFRPGDVLRKPEICAALGVSRSPVAEAVTRLAAEGLVDVVPQAGTYVARFSFAEICEGAFLREALELAAIEHIAEAISDEQLTLLQRNLRLQELHVSHGDIAGFYQADAQMHEMLLSFTGFRRLASLSETAWVHVNRARQLVLPTPGRVQATLIEHQAILRALEGRDPQAARDAMRAHLRQLVHFLEPLTRTRPDLFSQE